MISDVVRRFVETHVDSLEDLELLLLLIQGSDRWWDAVVLGEQLDLDTETARRILERLASHNLLAINVTGAIRYRYQPGHADLQEAADAFAEAFRTNRLAILNLITRRPRRSVSDFADAFRIDAMTIAKAIYLLCGATSLVAAVLLLRQYRAHRSPLLLWSVVGFVGLAVNNVLVYIDLVIVPTTDLSLIRTLPAAAGLLALLFGLIWGSRA